MGNPYINSGGGQWYAPSFDARATSTSAWPTPARWPAPWLPVGARASRVLTCTYPTRWSSSARGASCCGTTQLTPHDLYDWDLQDPPGLTTANGRPVVIDGGKAGILIELDAQTGRLLWKRPVACTTAMTRTGCSPSTPRPPRG